MTGIKDTPPFLESSNSQSQYLNSDNAPEHGTSSPTTRNDKQSKEDTKDNSAFSIMMRLVTQFCPWLTSTEECKKSFHKIETSIKERPMSSILYGLTIVFGFIPFAGFILLVCGSFALLFTSFIFCQFFAVLFSALVCTGVFWIMLCSFVGLAVMLGGTVHFFMLFGILSRHASRLARKLFLPMSQYLGIPETDLPGSSDSHQGSEE